MRYAAELDERAAGLEAEASGHPSRVPQQQVQQQQQHEAEPKPTIRKIQTRSPSLGFVEYTIAKIIFWIGVRR